MTANIKAVLRLFLFILLNILITITQGPLLWFHKGPKAYILPRLWHAAACRLFSIKITVEGQPETDRQTIYLSNHLSYMDIPTLGNCIPAASFVAKADVAKWPIFGFLSTLQQTAFISRSRHDAAKEKNSLDHMLATGKSLIIFPEGTSSDGRTVLPFKSSLFSLAFTEGSREPLTLQAITITLLKMDEKSPDDQSVRDLYAWHGDMTLAPHFWDFAKSKGATLLVRFHPPRHAADYTDRKALAQDCYEDVNNGLETKAQAA